MDSTYGAGEFWTNLNRQEMMELGMAPQHEGEDFYLSLLQQGEEMRRMQKQVKKQGLDGTKTELKAAEMTTLPDNLAQKVVLLPEHAKIKKEPKKVNTARLWKAMGLPAPKGTKLEPQNIALSKA
jgi:hypothetical protein